MIPQPQQNSITTETTLKPNTLILGYPAGQCIH